MLIACEYVVSVIVFIAEDSKAIGLCFDAHRNCSEKKVDTFLKK